MARVKNMKINLQVLFYQEGNQIVAFSPALDLVTHGKTTKSAEKNFAEVVDIFFEELAERGTTEEVLTSLGWKKTRLAGQSTFQPPKIVKEESIGLPAPVVA